MLATRLKAGGPGAPITFSTSGSRSGAGTLTLPAIVRGQMLALMERADSATPPALRSGFTDVVTVSNSAASRSMRISYILGPYGGASISFPQSASYIVMNNAKGFGATGISTGNAATTSTPTVPALTGVVTNGTSMAVYMSYQPSLTATSSPYTFFSNAGGYAGGLTANVAQTTATASTALFNTGASVEFRN